MIEPSPHTGEVRLGAGDEVVTIRFTWAGLSRLHGHFGPDWDQAIEKAFTTLDVEVLAKVLAAGSDRPASWWLEASPPFIPAAQAAREALNLAFFGPGREAEEPESAPDPRMRLAIRTLFARLFASGAKSQAEAPPASSGP